MITQEFLDLLRCPLDPSHARLEAAADGLVCLRCRLKYRMHKDGFPIFLPEEAELPPGCDSLDRLPCKQQPAPAAPEKEGKP
jgi:uncharacterized protein YbaR (Trm112 family)